MDTTWPPPPERDVSAGVASAALTEPPREPLSPGRILGYGLANLGYGAFYALNNAALPLWMGHYTSNALLIGLMASTHSFEGAIIQPLVGTASDRLRTPLGRRRPFLLAAVPVSVLFLLLAPLAAHLPAPVRLAAIVACVFLFTVAFNVAMDPYQALLPDITPPTQRGRVTGIWMFLGALGQVLLLLLHLPLPAKFVLAALLMLATTLLTCLWTPEPPRHAQSGPAPSRRAEVREALRGLRTLRQARTYLLMFFCYGAGTDAVLPFLTLFIRKITHCGEQTAQTMFVVLMAATALGMLVFGWVSDRIGPHKLLLVSLLLIAAAAANGLWVTTLPQVAAVLGLAGLGIAAQNASAYPLLTRLVPGEEIGFYTGLQTAAVAIAGPAALALTGALINHSGYRVIFAVCAVGIVAGLLILLRLRPHDAAGEIAARNREQGRAPSPEAAVTA